MGTHSVAQFRDASREGTLAGADGPATPLANHALPSERIAYEAETGPVGRYHGRIRWPGGTVRPVSSPGADWT